MKLAPLPRTFSARDADVVARALLGHLLVHVVDGAPRVGRIVETEAYLGPHDLACHSSKGRTKRTEVMFGPPGHAYVFLVYGMHHCVNVVTGAGAAVLLRGLAPVSEGLGRCDGPGRLSAALGLTLAHNTLPLDCSPDVVAPRGFDRTPLFIAEGTPVSPRQIGRSARVGVDYAGAWAKAPLRFFDRRVVR